jgi:hypothetical protein
LRTWACPKEPSPAVDGRFRFGSAAERAADKEASRPGRIGSYVRALFVSRTADPQMPAC